MFLSEGSTIRMVRESTLGRTIRCRRDVGHPVVDVSGHRGRSASVPGQERPGRSVGAVGSTIGACRPAGGFAARPVRPRPIG